MTKLIRYAFVAFSLLVPCFALSGRAEATKNFYIPCTPTSVEWEGANLNITCSEPNFTQILDAQLGTVVCPATQADPTTRTISRSMDDIKLMHATAMAGLLSGKKIKITYEAPCGAPSTGSKWVIYGIQLSSG